MNYENKYNKYKKKYLELKNKINKQNGGVVIGSGAFGCVIKPSIKCDDKVDKDSISKIIKKTDVSEFIIPMKIQEEKLDPYGIYFNKITGLCEITQEYFKKQDNNTKLDIIECTKKIEEPKVTINLSYAGKSLSEMINNNKFYRNHFDYMHRHLGDIIYHLIKGINILHKNNIIHSDIKPGNITYNTFEVPDVLNYNNKNPLKGLFRYIDFGHSFVYDDFIKNNSIEKLVDNIYSYPDILINNLIKGTPEFYGPEIFMYLILLTDKNKDIIKNEFIKNLLSDKGLFNSKTILKKGFDMIKFQRQSMLFNHIDKYDNKFGIITKRISFPVEKIKNIESLKKYFLGSKEENIKPLIFKKDIFALGKTLLILINFLKNGKQKRIDPKYYKLIANMINFDITNRWDSEKCLEVIKKIK